MTLIVRPGYLAEGDPSFSNVSLLLHGNGTNGSTTITDSSPTPSVITATGTAATISTAESKFGGTSIFFPSGTGNYLDVPNAAKFSLGTTWTVEWFGKTQGAYVAVWANSLFNTTGGIGIYYEDSSMRVRLGTTTFSFSTAIPADWHHFAVTCINEELRCFLDGSLLGTSSTSLSVSSGANYIRRLPGFNYGNAAYLDDLRITSGVARYTANFTPPDAPFPDAQY